MDAALMVAGFVFLAFDMGVLVWIMREDGKRNAAFMLRVEGFTGAASDKLSPEKKKAETAETGPDDSDFLGNHAP